MKLALAVIVLIVFGLSFVADHQWRKWIAQRRAERDNSDRTPHS
jgi:uncharacterized protein YjeT (DUF2065 family)